MSQNQVAAIIGSDGPQPCDSDWLIIPCASNVGTIRDGPYPCVDRICGGTFNSEVSLTPATLLSTVKPFRLIYHTDGAEYPDDASNHGFCLNYIQQPCTNLLNRAWLSLWYYYLIKIWFCYENFNEFYLKNHFVL